MSSSNKRIPSITLPLVLGMLWGATARADIATGLVGYWPLDGNAQDASGNNLHGTITKVTPAADRQGNANSAMSFTGAADSVINVGDPVQLQITGEMTLAAWVRLSKTNTNNSRIIAKSGAGGARSFSLNIEASSGGVTFPPTFQIGISSGASNLTVMDTKPLPTEEWAHMAGVYRPGTAIEIYVNGELRNTNKSGIPATQYTANKLAVLIGNRAAATNCGWTGLIDEARIYARALPASDIVELVVGRPGLASGPVPGVEKTDVPADANLSWTSGKFAATHNIYLGTSLQDVNDASVAKPLGALVRAGHDATTFNPGPLEFGKTYYWRIDEVNKAPDNTIYKGNVWSFTVEPYSYPVKPAKATASTAQPGMGPEKTIDGSGLTADLHGITPTTMWMSTGVGPSWIQYEFDKVYKLDQLLVWNSNQQVEAFVGFGARKVTIETALDGTMWTQVANVPEFNRAPGGEGYAANTTVNLGSAEAKYVKLTIQSPWGTTAQTGLSEVRFFYVPVQARAPQPATAATGVSLDATLDWRPGREATSHKLAFGTDPNALTTTKALTDHGYVPDALNFGTKYFWKVDEVGKTVTYPGEIWNFSTQEYQSIEDFESYTDKQGNEIFSFWVDGMTNSNGSIVGLYPNAINGTFCETTIIHGGRQSMPLEYNNIKTPYYSEAERTFDTPQNWTGNGADTLALWYIGFPTGFVDKGNNAFSVASTGTDIGGTADQFRYVCKQLSGNGSITVKVDSLINTNAWAKAGVMVRETLEANSRRAHGVMTPGNGAAFERRETTGGASASVNTSGLKAPYWVRLTRTGNTFKGERSPDGKTWTQIGANQDVIMGPNVYIGLCVTSHSAGVYTTAEFSNLETTGTVTGAWQSLSIGVAQKSNTPDPLYVTIEDKAGKKKTIVHPDPAAVTKNAWTQWRIVLSDLTGINLTAVKKLTIGVGDRASPKAGGAGTLYLDDIGFGHPLSAK